jgi:4-amino-4-deoxy-L-arabinose transferase-like glycosyltransferase
MALVDSMLTMFGVFSFLGAILIAKTKRLDVAMITGFLLGCAFLTKSPSLFFALLFPASLLVVEWPKKKSDKLTLLVKIVSLWGVALIIGYGMYNILRLGPNFHLLAQRNKDYVYPLTHILESPLDPFRPFIHRVYQYFLIMGPSVLIFLSALGAGINFKEKRREVLLILAWGLLPILVNSEFAKNMTARYVYFAIPYFFILGASVFLAKSEMMKKLVLAGFIVFVTHSLYINYHFLTDIEAAPLPRSERSGYLEEWTAGVGIKEIANQVKMIRDENGEKEIIVGTEGYFGTLPDGLLIYLEGEPRIRAIGVGLALNVIPEPLLESKKAGNLTYLVVNNERLHLNYDDFGMKLLAVYPKSTRPDGSRQALYLLELTDEALSPKSEIR